MELIFFGLNLLLILVVWHLMLRPTILDLSRDRLFNLRDALRERFIKEGWDLNAEVYKKLRDLANGYLRYTEEVSLTRISYINATVGRNKELQEFVHERMSKAFASNNPEQQKFTAEFRKSALMVAMDYSVFSSGCLLLVVLAMVPFVAFWKGISMVNRSVDFTIDTCIQRIRHLGGYVAGSISVATAYLAKAILLPDLLESYSFKRGTSL